MQVFNIKLAILSTAAVSAILMPSGVNANQPVPCEHKFVYGDYKVGKYSNTKALAELVKGPEDKFGLVTYSGKAISGPPNLPRTLFKATLNNDLSKGKSFALQLEDGVPKAEYLFRFSTTLQPNNETDFYSLNAKAPWCTGTLPSIAQIAKIDVINW